MSVDVFPQVRCFNYSTQAEPSLMVQWEYLIFNDTICMEEVSRIRLETPQNASENLTNSSNDSNESNDEYIAVTETILVPRPCIRPVWIPLANTSFRDENRRPGSLRVPAFSFQPNSSHQFRAAATFQAGHLWQDCETVRVSVFFCRHNSTPKISFCRIFFSQSVSQNPLILAPNCSFYLL